MWSDMRGRNSCSERSSLFLIWSLGCSHPPLTIGLLAKLTPPLSPASAKSLINTLNANTTAQHHHAGTDTHHHLYTLMETLHSINICEAPRNTASSEFMICSSIHSCKQADIPHISEWPTYTNTQKMEVVKYLLYLMLLLILVASLARNLQHVYRSLY